MRVDQKEWKRLRDEFAGQALMGLLAGTMAKNLTPEKLAAEAYRIADAMLAESRWQEQHTQGVVGISE